MKGHYGLVDSSYGDELHILCMWEGSHINEGPF